MSDHASRPARSTVHRSVRVVAPLLVCLALLTAVATPAIASTRGGAEDRPDLPPATKEAIAAIFDAKLARLGLRTTRATLQNLKTYRSDPNGRHLAIYVEPTGASSSARYLATLLKSARVFLPKVFREWSDLESFDICQEPVAGVDDSAEPAPMTQLLVSRKGTGYVRWKHATLAALVRQSAEPRGTAEAQRDFYLYVDPQVAKDQVYRSALATVSTTSTTVPGR